jgi:ABC-type branched-subunit amino acid transport system substrate-binding protein
VAAIAACTTLGLLVACSSPQKAQSTSTDSSGASSHCPAAATTKITGDIKIGVSAPLSGVQAALGQLSVGFKKYTDYINSQGGVDGHKLDVTILDDKGDPSQAVANAQKLISQDHVNLLAGITGTPQTLAIAPIAVQSCIPILFVASGSADLAAGKYAGVLPATTPYAGEAIGITTDILKAKPKGATLGIIAVQNDTGTGLSSAVKAKAEAAGITVLPIQSLDPTQTSAPATQLQALENKADFLDIIAGPAQCPVALTALAQTGWKPTTYVIDNCAFPSIMKAAGASANNVRAVTYIIDPTNPAYASRPDVKTFLAALGTDPGVNIAAIGWVNGAGTVAVIKRAAASGSLTSQSLITASQGLSNVTLPLLPDGVTATTSTTSMNPWASVEVVQFSAGHWSSLYSVPVK